MEALEICVSLAENDRGSSIYKCLEKKLLWTVVRRQQDHLHRRCLGICSNSLQMNYRKSKSTATLTHSRSKATCARAAARTVFLCLRCDNFSFELAMHQGASPEEFEAYRVGLRKVITAVVLSTRALALRVASQEDFLRSAMLASILPVASDSMVCCFLSILEHIPWLLVCTFQI